MRLLVVGPGLEPEDYVWPTHDVEDRFIYRADFTRWLQLAGATLASVAVTRSPDPALTVSAVSLSTPMVEIEISGGTADTTAKIGIQLTLNDGQEAEFVIALPIVDRGAGLVPI